MRYGLAAIGVLFLVVGAILFNTPTPVPAASPEHQLFFMFWLQALAPRQLAMGLMVIGAICGLIALFLREGKSIIPNAPYDTFRAKMHVDKKAK